MSNIVKLLIAQTSFSSADVKWQHYSKIFIKIKTYPLHFPGIDVSMIFEH